jgi:hypothetical protein
LTALVSVFTPAHETGSAIGIPYRSLCAQTSSDWEWVVLDDSDGHETAEHLGRIAASDPRVRVHRSEPLGSIGASKAAVAALCEGAILVELDHDDELLSQAVEAVTAVFAADPRLDFAYSDWIDLTTQGDGVFPAGWGFGFGAYANESVGGRRRTVALAPPVTWETIRHIVAAPNHLRAWRAEFYSRIGGHDPAFRIGDDYELVVRTFLEGTMARIPRPLYVQHHHEDARNASRRMNAEIQERVAEVSALRERGIDERCLSLGAIPNAAEPLTCAEPIHAANALADPFAEGLISVVIPTYRRPDLLRRAIDSALAQSYPHIEVLVVGDACPDFDVPDDPRIRSWNLDVHHGDGGAGPRNHALKTMARGSLVAYLDDDNVWQPDHLSSLAEALGTNAFAFSSYTALGEEIICREPRRFQIDTSALLHRRDLLDVYGYWRPLAETDWAHDWELVSRWEDEPWAATLRPTLAYTLADDERGRGVLAAMRGVAEEVPGV